MLGAIGHGNRRFVEGRQPDIHGPARRVRMRIAARARRGGERARDALGMRAKMASLFLVMLGGASGAAARWGVGLLLGPNAFPWATLTVNLVGGLLMGIVAALVERGSLGESGRLLLGVGVLGGFTTFSAFGLETLRMIERGAVTSALAYATVSVVGAIAMTTVGLVATRLL